MRGFARQKKRRLHKGGVGPEMLSPAGCSSHLKEKRPLRGVGPKMLSTAGLTVRILPFVAGYVNLGAAPASRKCDG